MAQLLQRLGAFSARRRRTVLVGWLLAFVVLGGLTAAFKGTFTTEFKIPGTESQDAAELVSERIPGTNPNNATGTVVFHAKDGTLTGGERRAAVAESVAALGEVAKVDGASDPFAAKAVSEDGTVAYSSLTFGVNPQDVTEDETAAIERATEAAAKAGLQVEFGGAAAPVEGHAPIGEAIGFLVALVVLAITFGSLFAAGLPLITGVLGVGVGALGITLASGFVDLADTSITIAVMLGLAVGIDYTLFILSRHRTQVADGMPVDASIAKAVGTAGSAVVFAGATVIIALVGLAVTGVPFLAQMGIGAAFTIAAAVLLSLTLTPALLSFAGDRAVRGKTFTEDAHDPASDARPTMGARWIALVVRRRIAAIAVVGVALLALAIPALDMRLGLPGDNNKGTETTERRAYDLLSGGFGPGFNGPLTVVADLQGAKDPQAAADATAKRLGGLDDIATTAPAQLGPNRDVAIVQIVPASAPDAPATEALVKDIRGQADAIERETGAEIGVTGQTATNIDISQRMADSLIPYLAVVVGLALVLLLIAFRSILVPLTAIGGFLLTIVASFGVVTLVFQEGVGASLIGVAQTGPLVSLLPILIIGVIFGLAMDYQVFLVSRMREEHAHGADPQDAVRDGFRHSARVVTAAGLIMISVFAGFIIPDDPIVKSIGLAFATGILIDAFLIRMTLIPALMSVLGERAWWMPAWLDRIVPNVDIEGTSLERHPSDRRAEGPAAVSPTSGD